MPRPKLTLEQSISGFWDRVEKTDSCWLWKGAINYNGYGRLYWLGNENGKAHRISWSIIKGPVPRLIRHKCDVPNCVNPTHLEEGTEKDNSRDMVSRGRSQKGEAHSQSKYSDDLVSEIKTLHKNGIRQLEIVKMFGISSGTVSRYCKGKSRNA